MIYHYLKIAFRNLWKYKNQTFISVVGLAVGFTCFAMATLWIRYEMTYDGFHKNADRIYRVSIKDDTGYLSEGESRIKAPLAPYLEKTFPEIKHATKVTSRWWCEIDGVSYDMKLWLTDSSFLKIFNIKILEGNKDFLISGSKKVAITQEKALQLFGKESPIGKPVMTDVGDCTIGAVITGFSKHSNIPFEMLVADIYSPFITAGEIIVELAPGIDLESLRKKLYETKTTLADKTYSKNIEKITIAPLTSIHYKDPYISASASVQFRHVIIFAVSGSLLILCTLFNYFALFLSRFRIRLRELALRVVCGASNRSLFVLLSVEFVMSLIIAIVLGMLLIQTIIPHFRALSRVDIELSFIYFESLVYIGIIILMSLLTFLSALAIFRRKALNVNIRRGNSKMFRKISIIVQLIISISFAFCTTVILKQMYYLHNTDVGFDYRNVGIVALNFQSIDTKTVESHVQQIPEITETVSGFPVFVRIRNVSNETFDWNERPENIEPIQMDRMYISEKFVKIYELQLLEGEMLNENDGDEYILINESAAKIFGWHKPVGKTFTGDMNYIVKGVLKNTYNFSPVIPVRPTIYKQTKKEVWPNVTFKYRERTWKTCKEKLNRLCKEKYPEFNIEIFNEEDRFNNLFDSENTLLTLLTLISLVCVFICVFGFVSMVSLTCEERRKEIAIRKVSGATVKDILDIFFKEYLTLLAVGALIAFPLGYYIMKRWLEQYVIQTEISAWIYAAILLALILAIVLCVGGKVYKTSRENPVIAIKEN